MVCIQFWILRFEISFAFLLEAMSNIHLSFSFSKWFINFRPWHGSHYQNFFPLLFSTMHSIIHIFMLRLWHCNIVRVTSKCVCTFDWYITMQVGGVINKINGFRILYPSQKQKLFAFLGIHSYPKQSHIITYFRTCILW